MTMTLGFDALGYLEALFDEETAHEIVATLAKHAPRKPLRVARYGRDGYVVSEVADGKSSPSKDATIAAAIEGASGVDWDNSDAPLGVSPILLPGRGWDLAALRKEKVIRSEEVAFHWGASEAGKARELLGSECDAALDVAEEHNLVIVFR